ncbi:Uncharacterized protein OS=Rhodopirellula baltica SWK14 GN=RBSWK_04635 PE=4 SV=1 [Gemmata massiliana]|uniref:Uncharacterized protein n=1 Tax=Gemmata massiliana TaxID=1210884 RepID=A0A6P2D3Q5_9BACT|nr:hypothetical protein [Gemmata massiliana]VTR95941.1 Uncharacterized protein OS=Rhodopirellula baltica SWK14 GN=RBSWK_04635 PE=4 SV=1 [Gemmata massiliana]
MYDSQAPWVELYHALMDYDGVDAYTDLLEMWPDRHPEELHWLATFADRGERRAAEADEDLCRLYAASRVTSILLLRFQTGRADGTDYTGPPISVDGYQLFHEALGFRVPEATPFHPFFHEIIRVQPATTAGAPIEVVNYQWPPLMLGDMMYCRAGCVVTGGADHVVQDVAEHSRLYWAFRRKHRPYEDQSHRWGGNSQWRTRLRRDYQSPNGFRYNVDGEVSLNEATGVIEGVEVPAVIELVRHRCLICTNINGFDLYPYSYTYTER